ncbi:MAG: spore coat associated protein CotJA [Ruminococcaceae bacterium]|nr:spore coat associated protein CotJA [Oscillospiraceae bacterium]
MPRQDTDCACKKAPFPVNTALAMAYVPFQQNGEVYSCERALSRGTAFPCLDKPFLMGCCR